MLCLVNFTVFSATIHTTLKRAILKKMISVNASSKGGFCGKCLKINVSNNTNDTLNIDVDPGLIFKSEDSTYTNLILLGVESFTLMGGAIKDTEIQTFSSSMDLNCPKAAINYSYWRMADTNLVKVLKYAKDNDVDKYVAQRAVWVFTNAQCVSTVFSHLYPRVSEDFVKFIVANKKGTNMPVFYVEYRIDNIYGRPVLDLTASKIYANMHYGHDGYRHMYVKIYKEDKTLYKYVYPDQVIDKEGHILTVEFDSQGDPKGSYSVELHDDFEKIWDKKIVKVGVSPCEM